MKIRKKSVVVRVNFMISVIIFCMIVMLVFSCLSAMKTVWKKSMRTYQSMGEYYAGDVASNLKNILEYFYQNYLRYAAKFVIIIAIVSEHV